MLTMAESRMADGAATLAIVLSHLWQDAGNPSAGMTVAVQVPAWVAPNYPLTSSGPRMAGTPAQMHLAGAQSFDEMADQMLQPGRGCYLEGDGDCE